MGKFIQKGDKREVSAETRRKLSEAGSLHGGYKELRRWKKEGKYPDLRTHFGKYIRRVATQIAEDLGGMSALNMKQRILLDRVIEKLVFLERIGAWSMEQDWCFHEGILKTWQSILPDAEVQRFDDAGHYLLEDAGEAVTGAIRQFDGRLNQRP